MIKGFLRRYLLSLVIGWTVLVVLIHQTITAYDDFGGWVPTVLAYLVVLGGNVGLIIHARQWVRRNRK